jgi:DNA-binding LacI/PurR family transcriptional regulator
MQIPFHIYRNSRESLTDQIVNGFKRSVASGDFKRGEILPPARDIAKSLGVSFTVMRSALARLTAEGVVNPRRHVGTEIVGTGVPLYQGRVLMVIPDGDDCFYQNILVGRLRRQISDAGYLFVQEVVRRDSDGRFDFAHLDFTLSQGVDLAIQMFDRPVITRHLASQKVPWFLIGDGPDAPEGAAGLIHVDRCAVAGKFADHCRKAKVKSVLQVGVIPHDADALGALGERGVKAEEWLLHDGGAFQRIDEVQRCALEAFEKRIASEDRKWLPDVIFFKDDFVAAGAMTALLRNGIRIPEDVRVATWANKGLGPVYHRSFTRMEMDPLAHGEKIADWIIRYLKCGKPPKNMVVAPVYIRGETL